MATHSPYHPYLGINNGKIASGFSAALGDALPPSTDNGDRVEEGGAGGSGSVGPDDRVRADVGGADAGVDDTRVGVGRACRLFRRRETSLIKQNEIFNYFFFKFFSF